MVQVVEICATIVVNHVAIIVENVMECYGKFVNVCAIALNYFKHDPVMLDFDF
jgi:hypothetical protein